MVAPAKVAAHPSRHVYDAIVIGGQLAGAVTAALLAKRGQKVLLVEHDGLGQGYEHNGFLLPYAPFITPATKFGPVIDEVLTELGLHTAASRALRPHTPELQLVLPGHRFDLHAQDARRAAELTREFGDQGKELASAVSQLIAFHEKSDDFIREPVELPPDGMMQAWSLKGAMRRFPGLSSALPLQNGEPAMQLLQKLIPFLTHQAESSSALARGRALSQTLASPERFPGGREGLRELLAKKVADLGGDLMARDGGENFIVEYIALEGDRAVGVKLLQSDMVYRADAVIVATDSGAMRRLIVEKTKHRKLMSELDSSSTKQFLFAVNWVLDASAIPRGMGELVLVATDDDLNPLLIQQHAARKVGGKEEEGLRVLTTAAFVPTSARDLGEQHLTGLQERIGAHLDVLMPFARPHVVLTSTPHLHAGGLRGSRFLPHPLFHFEEETILGVEGLKQRTPVKNLFLANREVLPGLGLEGEFMAGRRAARLVAAKKKA